MHWRWWGIFVVFCVALVANSCREALDPNEDRNRAPDTYLTASPADSIAGGSLSRVPYRYHAFWSGADLDGEVVGFFIAVTETLPGRKLPPPKPQQYTFTQRTDSVFVFAIHEGFGTDREHGLYVYSVDNEGKVDPDPAFVHFIARDRNLPGLRFNLARAEGQTFIPDGLGGLIPVPFELLLTDNEDPVGSLTLPRDTIPFLSSVFFGWQGFDNDWNSSISGYRYKLMEPAFNNVDSTVKYAEYATGVGTATDPLPVGLNLFRIRSIDEAGGSSLDDSIRRFVVNFDSDTWWAGPSPSDPSIAPSLLTDNRGQYLVGDIFGNPPAELVPWLGDERYDILPAERPDVPTFIEKVRFPNEFRYYFRADSDTVARNAEAVFLFGGGLDKDSPYSVEVGDLGVGLGRVGMPGPANGSPIGFEFRIINRLVVTGGRNNPAWSLTYPNFNPLNPAFQPEVNFEAIIDHTGDSYAQLRSVDGNNGKDNRIRDPLQYIEMYDAGEQDRIDRSLRTKVFRWFTNYNPYYMMDHPLFVPQPDTLILDANFDSRLFMSDPDSTSGGNKAPFLVRVRFISPREPPAQDIVTAWQPDVGFRMVSGGDFKIIIPSSDLDPGQAYFEFELSDLPDDSLDDRRIVTALIPFFWQVMP